MSADPVRLGFIGFGEAASRFAKDFSQAGLQGIVAYSRSAAKAPADDPVLDALIEIKAARAASAKARTP